MSFAVSGRVVIFFDKNNTSCFYWFHEATIFIFTLDTFVGERGCAGAGVDSGVGGGARFGW